MATADHSSTQQQPGVDTDSMPTASQGRPQLELQFTRLETRSDQAAIILYSVAGAGPFFDFSAQKF